MPKCSDRAKPIVSLIVALIVAIIGVLVILCPLAVSASTRAPVYAYIPTGGFTAMQVPTATSMVPPPTSTLAVATSTPQPIATPVPGPVQPAVGINWVQVVASLATNALFLAVVGFFGKSLVERWFEGRLERYKSELRQAEVEHKTRFTLLHEKRSAVITELYRLLVQTQRSMDLSAQGIHQWADGQVEMSREKRRDLSLQHLDAAVTDYRNFARCCEDSRIYLSDELIERLDELLSQLRSVLHDLEATHQSLPPNHEGLPPSIRATWEAQRKLRVFIDPIREELELEFRRILGAIDTSASV